ncbi:unnamed protein product [Effrenium voratum]|nr:unnamed protein product [Effrenium voratum]
MSVPPLIRCHGVRSPHAKAINGIYEYMGAHSGRPCYRQTGVSSGNFVWYCQDALEGAMWVVTHQEARPGEAPESAVARAPHLGRWPWEVEGWQVCSRNDVFLDQPKMGFSLVLPAAELIVQAPAMDASPSACGFRRAGFVHGKVAFRRFVYGKAGDRELLGYLANTEDGRLLWPEPEKKCSDAGAPIEGIT